MRTPFLLVTLLATSLAFGNPGSEPLTAGQPAPAINFGKVVKGKAPKLNGGVAVVEFWATWCGPCRATIPHLTELAKKYQGKVTFTGVSVWERGEDTQQQVDSFVKEMGVKMDYNVLSDTADGFMAKNWMTAAGQNAIPTAFIVGRDGKIAWIGHPMKLEPILAKVVDGTFDVAADQARIAREAAEVERNKTELQRLLEPYQAAVKASNFDGAITELDKLVEAHPEYLERVVMLKFRLVYSKDPVKGAAYAREMATGPLKSSGVMLVNLAWSLLDEAGLYKVHDYEAAAFVAEQASKVSGKNASIGYDLLAQAKAKLNDRPAAIAAWEKAIASAKEANAEVKYLDTLEKRLEDFRKG